MTTAEQQPPTPTTVDSKFIYVVDDEAMIGDVVQIILKMDGFRPRFFQDPEVAWTMFQQEQPKPALLLTDYLMCPINGMELIQRCKQSQPVLKTILYSGNVSEDILHRYAIEPDAFLRKPFLPKTLLGLVRLTLQGATAAVWCVAGSAAFFI
jgi:DNA-binding NtrC family response regulator